MKSAARIFPVALLALWPPTLGHAWEFHDIEGSGVGTLNACAASDMYRDGFLSIRLYGDDMDLVFRKDEFALPFSETLGVVAINVDSSAFSGMAISLDKGESDVRSTTSTMQILLRSGDYSGLFDALRNGQELVLIFPSGDAYSFPLTGSARALNMAADCWTRKETGPDEKNPFSVPEQSNPFNANEPEARNPFERDA